MPNDVTEDEFIDMMAKFGIIMQDPETGIMFEYSKIKNKTL